MTQKMASESEAAGAQYRFIGNAPHLIHGTARSAEFRFPTAVSITPNLGRSQPRRWPGLQADFDEIAGLRHQ